MNNRFVSTDIDEDAHRSLLLVATEKGVHPSSLVRDYIVQGLVDDVQEMGVEANPALQVWQSVLKVKQRSRIRAQLLHIAHEHLENPTEESADQLNSLCELVEIPVESILEDAHDAYEVPLINDDGSGVASAMHWLQNVMERGEDYPATFITDLAEKSGFSHYIVKVAKQRLSIPSTRKGKRWVWSLPDGEEVIGDV